MSDELLDHVRALRAYARSLCGNPTEADDLTQETLLRALNSASQYQPGTHMKSWLFTIMRNRFYTNRKKAARERTGVCDVLWEAIKFWAACRNGRRDCLMFV